MKNVKMSTSKDGKLTIVVDLTKDFGQSASGKSVVIATTAGNKPVPGADAMIGLNVYRSK